MGHGRKPAARHGSKQTVTVHQLLQHLVLLVGHLTQQGREASRLTAITGRRAVRPAGGRDFLQACGVIWMSSMSVTLGMLPSTEIDCPDRISGVVDYGRFGDSGRDLFLHPNAAAFAVDSLTYIPAEFHFACSIAKKMTVILHYECHKLIHPIFTVRLYSTASLNKILHRSVIAMHELELYRTFARALLKFLA